MTIFKQKTFLVFAFVLFGSLTEIPVALAAPVISGTTGTWSHGGSVTVSGANFGTRSDYNDINDTWYGHRFMNFRWTDFGFSTFPSEASYTSNPTQTDGFYPQRGGGYWDVWAASGLSLNAGGPSPSGKFLQRRMVLDAPESGGSSVDVPGSADSANTLYIANKFAMISSGTTQQSGKAWRVYGDGAAGSMFITSGGTGGLSLRGEGLAQDCPPGFNGDGVIWGGPFDFTLGQWERVDLLFDRPSGLVRTYVNGAEQWAAKWWCDFGLGGHTIDLPNMIDDAFRGGGTEGSYNYTDVYIDFTQARVELCNASTKTASSACEIQLPISWTANTIQVAVNKGEFANGNTAYLYVCDSAGSCNSSGTPIVIAAGGADTTPPAAPTGLGVQ